MSKMNKQREQIRKQLSGRITWYGMTEKQREAAVNQVIRGGKKRKRSNNTLPMRNKNSIINYLASHPRANYNRLLSELRLKGLLRNLSVRNLNNLKLNTNIRRHYKKK